MTERPHSVSDAPVAAGEKPIVNFSSARFLLLCVVLSVVALVWGARHPFPSTFIAAEVMLTIVALFFFGSTRFVLHKNALTLGSALVVSATFFTSWWPSSALRADFLAQGGHVFLPFVLTHVLSLSALDELIHADTMLFILGLTLFVTVIAQTRLLESLSFYVLRKNHGRVLPTVAVLTGLVSMASGILAGVSMIGLTIRTLVIILFLSKTDDDDVIFAVVISTVITTVCGMWLAYGEPPNLIMKENLHPFLDNAYFIHYCLPAAVATYLIVLYNVRKRLKGQHVAMRTLDVLDLNTADVRFLQAATRGDVPTAIEYLETCRDAVGGRFGSIFHHLHQGMPLGAALVREDVPRPLRLSLLAGYVSPDLAEALDEHYVRKAAGGAEDAESALKIRSALADVRRRRVRAQWIGAFSFVPFIGLLIAHGMTSRVALYWPSFAGFAFAWLGIMSLPKTRALALHEAKIEYLEYLFLFPLFLSITLLNKAGFFSIMSVWLHNGIETVGTTVIAFIQYAGACVLSALLDNNIVADFASRALTGLGIGTLHVFSTAQIAGYAAGGCWTHIGSAQSIVAYAFIRREVNERYTPMQWIKVMTPIIIQISVMMLVLICAQDFVLRMLHAS